VLRCLPAPRAAARRPHATMTAKGDSGIVRAFAT